MLVAYVDESNHDDWVSFGAVIAEPEVIQSLTAALNEVVADASFRHDSILSTTELHGYELFHGTDGWANLDPRPRIRIYREALHAICGHDLKIVIRWCSRKALAAHQERKKYPDRWPAEQPVFQFLLQRVNTLARRENTQALVIVDMRDDREAHRERFAEYQRHGTPGTYMSTKLDSLIDTVHFVPSHHSRMIQAADLVTYMHRRVKTIKESDPRAQKVVDGFHRMLLDSDALYGCGSWP